MQTFIDQVIEEIMPYADKDLLVIVPTRRAASLLKSGLAIKRKSTGFLPSFIPVADLITMLCPLPIADDNSLLLYLFEAYKKSDPEITIDDFLKWGGQVLDDFNEIDRNLINAKGLFKKVAGLKELEEIFQPDSEEIELLNVFWTQFSMKPLSPLKEEFLRYWEILPALYSDFNNLLQSKNIAYEGMAWKWAAENISSNDKIASFKKVVFAGFYAMTKTEESIASYLDKQGKLVMLVDADNYYTLPKYQEAGMFFRKGYLADHKNKWSSDFLSTTTKNISITGVPGKSAMAHELAVKVSNLLQNVSPEDRDASVVVLPDDSLLYPFLLSLTKTAVPFNPSMGFPIAQFPFMHLLKSVKIIRTQLLLNNDDISYSEFVKSVLQHPIISLLTEGKSKDTETNLRNKILQHLITIHSSVEDENKNLIEFVSIFEDLIDPVFPGIYKSIVQQIILLSSRLKTHFDNLTIKSYWQLLFAELEKVRLPFLIPDKQGVHIMGFLETRVADYKNVFIASLNEGTLPGDSIPKSLIPYSIRKAYHLPCKEEQEAVTAYHFYRLLQRASEVHLFYNNDITDLGGGERSRYLLQLEMELVAANPNINIQYLQANYQPQASAPVKINVKKSPEIVSYMKQKYFYVDEQDTKGKGFSASSLSSYIHCSLKFYLEQIAGLRINEISTAIDPMVFGKILHKCMENIYEGTTEVSKEYIQGKSERLIKIIDDATSSEFRKGALTGNDLLLQGVIEELIKRLLNYDESQAPFTILGLERELAIPFEISPGLSVRLKGIFDRIDYHGKYTHILDYKTGGDDPSLPKELTSLFNDSKRKIPFQVLMYVLIYQRINPNALIKAGIYQVRKSAEKVVFLTNDEPVSQELISEYSEALKDKIAEIFNEEIDFKQTDDIKKCGYCDFIRICNRMN